jgi:hypothetical protein
MAAAADMTKRDELIAQALAALADPRAFTTESDALVEQIRPMLAGRGPAIQGSVLADLVAIWIAGHQTRELQAAMLEVHRQTVADLIEHYNAKRKAN